LEVLKLTEPFLELRNFSVYRGGRAILTNLNIVLHRGEKIVIAGVNGVGKTSLAEAILGFVPFKGELILEGKPVKEKKDFKILRRKVGYVFQNPDNQLFMPTVRDELLFAPKNYKLPEEIVEKLFQKVVNTFNLTHLLDRPTFKLSFGQKRLVSLACVLTYDPEMLILDEPTNGLDRENWFKVAEFLKKSDKTLMVITHDRELISFLGWRVIYLSSLSFVTSYPPKEELKENLRKG